MEVAASGGVRGGSSTSVKQVIATKLDRSDESDHNIDMNMRRLVL